MIQDRYLRLAESIVVRCERGLHDCNADFTKVPCRYSRRTHSPAFVLTLAGQLEIDAMDGSETPMLRDAGTLEQTK